MRVSVDISGLEQIDQLLAAVDDTKPLHDAIGRTLLTRINLGFKASKSPWGKTWRELVVRAGQPLRDTGVLQRSITYEPSAQGVVVGTNLRYAKTHQFGATITPRTAQTLRFMAGNRAIFAQSVTIPARPFMPITTSSIDLPESWLNAVTKTIQRHFERLGE